LDDLETGVTPPAPANDDAPAAKPPGKPRKKARRNIGALPKHLPRCEQVLEPDTTACPCCQGRLHKIGEDVSEVLDVIPAILRVLRTPEASLCPRASSGTQRRHRNTGWRAALRSPAPTVCAPICENRPAVPPPRP
jgi:hypothetical protein